MGRGGGGNVTNTFNPTFNPTNVNAGRDIRDTSIIGGGPNTAGRDITGAGGDVETGDGGGGITVTGPGCECKSNFVQCALVTRCAMCTGTMLCNVHLS